MSKRIYFRLYCWFKALSLANKVKCVWWYTSLTFTLCIGDASVAAIVIATINFMLATAAIKTVPTRGIDGMME